MLSVRSTAIESMTEALLGQMRSHVLCLVFAFRYQMQLQNEYSVMLLLCSGSGKVVILNVLRQISCHFACFKIVFLVFLTEKWRLRTRA